MAHSLQPCDELISKQGSCISFKEGCLVDFPSSTHTLSPTEYCNQGAASPAKRYCNQSLGAVDCNMFATNSLVLDTWCYCDQGIAHWSRNTCLSYILCIHFIVAVGLVWYVLRGSSPVQYNNQFGTNNNMISDGPKRFDTHVAQSWKCQGNVRSPHLPQWFPKEILSRPESFVTFRYASLKLLAGSSTTWKQIYCVEESTYTKTKHFVQSLIVYHKIIHAALWRFVMMMMMMMNMHILTLLLAFTTSADEGDFCFQISLWR